MGGGRARRRAGPALPEAPSGRSPAAPQGETGNSKAIGVIGRDPCGRDQQGLRTMGPALRDQVPTRRADIRRVPQNMIGVV